ncbi:MAG: CRISPR-associated helicase Cas3' [Casimicrobiaceae bacterium]|nr:CRISPR-associated helicase Cas3' [Casimicrobiaceae bacterium]
MPETVRTVPWGKRNAFGEEHPLVDHCLDVAVVFRALVALQPFHKRLRLTAQQLDRLAVVALLHDFGKCNRGFQAKALADARATAGHILEALALLLELRALWPPAWQELIKDLAGWFANEDQALQMLLASLSHHGRPLSLSDYEGSGAERLARRWWQEDRADDSPLAGLEALAQRAREAFPDAFARDVPVIDATAELQHRFAGLVMLADWIGSDTQFFPYRKSAKEDRLALAREAASRALRAIGLATPALRLPRAFESTFGFAPNPLQAALAERVPTDDSTRLLLAESDTGSGKTEAALAWFFRLYREGKVDGLYFALPTRVAAREIYGRVLNAIEAAFAPEHRPTPVLLAEPGYVRADGESVPPILTDPHGTLWDDRPQDQQRERLWSAERPKRFLAAPIAVGTVDQALLSALQVKHSLLRSVCLDRHLLVVDEVHASDPYMREVLGTLLEGHLRRGSWALLLSATLGEAAAARFFGRNVLPLGEALARPYPLLSARGCVWPLPSTRERSIRVELSPSLNDDTELIPRLITALAEGARVLVVCNTVARANTLFRRVEAMLESQRPDLLPALFSLDGVRCPHHGRFAREDRERLDAAVTAQLGKASPEGPRLLIGTQTLEQSLDIDADWLVTDLAPMDVLLQRFGRLHRHHRPGRPQTFAKPYACVRVPARDLADYLTERGELKGPAGLGRVYADGRVLALTLDVLNTSAELELPRHARRYIEQTTHPEYLARLSAPWSAHAAYLEGVELASIRQAVRSVLTETPFGELHYPDKSEDVLTRLGQPTYEVPLAEPMRSPFGAFVKRLSIPAHWLKGVELPERLTAEPCDDGFRVQIADQRFRYTRLGLEKEDA